MVSFIIREARGTCMEHSELGFFLNVNSFYDIDFSEVTNKTRFDENAISRSRERIKGL